LCRNARHTTVIWTLIGTAPPMAPARLIPAPNVVPDAFADDRGCYLGCDGLRGNPHTAPYRRIGSSGLLMTAMYKLRALLFSDRGLLGWGNRALSPQAQASPMGAKPRHRLALSGASRWAAKTTAPPKPSICAPAGLLATYIGAGKWPRRQAASWAARVDSLARRRM